MSKSTLLANIYDFTIYQFPTRCMMSIVIIWKPKFLLIQQAGGVTWKLHKQSNYAWITTKKIPKKNTLTCYQFILFKLQAEFGQRDINAISQDDILSFLSRITAGNKQNTKRNRFTTLSAFFNFIITTFDLDLKNPCETLILQKMFKRVQIIQWNILEKDTVDEIIFRTTNPRNRIMLELMSRAGMRISEVLKLTPTDTDGRKLTLRNPKSG